MRKTVFLLAGFIFLSAGNFCYAQSEARPATEKDPVKNTWKGDKVQNQKAEYYLGLGWRYLDEGELEKALENFTCASMYPEYAAQAKLGRGFYYLKKNSKGAALKVFTELADAGVRDGELLPTLISLLEEKGDFEEARKYLAMADGKTRDYWTLRLNMETFDQKLKKILGNGVAQDALSLLDEYEEEYRHCVAPGDFLKIAGFIREQAGVEKAVGIYKSLLDYCKDDDEARIAVLNDFKEYLGASEITEMLRKEESSGNGKYREKLAELRLGSLRQALSAVPSSEPAANELANEILRVSPDDEFALASLAWWHYHKEQYTKAIGYFARLSRMRPENESYAQGLTYTQIKLNTPDEMPLNDSAWNDSASELERIRKDLFFNKMAESFGRRKYGDIERYLKKLARMQPENREYQVLLAWTLYYSFKEREALPIFMKLYKRGENLPLAEVIHEICKDKGITKEEADFLEMMSDTEELKAKNAPSRQSMLGSPRQQ